MPVQVTDFAQVNQPLLFEMIRSFTTLARTLNLSHAVEELNSTRQTVRRHIAQLEELRGERLFDVVNRRYELTEAGNAALPSALSLLGHGRLWLRGQIKDVDGLMGMSYEEGSEWYYHQQQQPINVAWSNKSPLLRAAIQCWAETEGALEHPKMMQVRPYALIYRDTAAGWICIEVGEQSFYSKWWGWANARSSVGRSLNQFPLVQSSRASWTFHCARFRRRVECGLTKSLPKFLVPLVGNQNTWPLSDCCWDARCQTTVLL